MNRATRIEKDYATAVIEHPRIATQKALYVIEECLYVGIDNSTGDAWVEEFRRLSDCLRWLRTQMSAMEVIAWRKRIIRKWAIKQPKLYL
jgi:phosphoribosylaminoimidazole (AIR) synthetase